MTSLDSVVDGRSDVAAHVMPMTDIDGQLPDHLTRFEDVVLALGGVKRVSVITQRSRSSVWNWSQEGQFPAPYFRVIRDALALRGKTADMKLFAFTRVPKKLLVSVVTAA